MQGSESHVGMWQSYVNHERFAWVCERTILAYEGFFSGFLGEMGGCVEELCG